MKKNIAIFVKNLASGGAEKQSVLLAKAMTKVCNVHYIIFNGKHIHQKYLDLLQEDADVQIMAFHGSLLSRFMQFIRYVKTNHIGYIFSYLTAANLLACMAGRMTDAKTITGLRNAKLPWAKQFADKLLTNHLADLTVCNCYSGKENFCAHGFSDKKIDVIPNCFEHIAPYKQKTEHKEIRVITVGRFVAQKDYETAIKSIKLTAEQCPELRFIIVGYGELEQQIREWIKEYQIEDITTIYINPDNISHLLDEADIYLSTSLFEGTSNSIMEAMNANLPIVATNVGDNKELVKDGQNGFLLPIKNVNGLSFSLIKLCNNLSLRLEKGKASKEFLEHNYSMDKAFLQGYSAIIEII